MQGFATKVLFLGIITFALISVEVPRAMANTTCLEPDHFLRAAEQKDLTVDSSVAVFITHSSSYFDPGLITKSGTQTLVDYAVIEKIPLFYLHDAGNDGNPFSGYMYEHCSPDAYIYSEIGHHSVDLKNVQKLYVAGGYFELCQQNTVTDSIRSMTKNELFKEVRVVQVLDAIFSVAQEKEFSDSFYPELYQLQQDRTFQTGKFTVSLQEITTLMADTDLVLEYFSRRVALMPLPPGWGVDLLYKDTTLNVRSGLKNKTIKFEYVLSGDLETFVETN